MSEGAPSGLPRSKAKPRPAKLKTPLEQLLLSEGAGGGGATSEHRPIGTPPPTSLRKSAHGEATGNAFCSSGEHFGFPKISVEASEEQDDDDDDDEGQGPRQDGGLGEGGIGTESQTPDNRRPSLGAENNNEGGGGLSPPTRLVTRDQDGVVFEITTGGGHEGTSTGKHSPLTPTRKKPILK